MKIEDLEVGALYRFSQDRPLHLFINKNKVLGALISSTSAYGVFEKNPLLYLGRESFRSRKRKYGYNAMLYPPHHILWKGQRLRMYGYMAQHLEHIPDLDDLLT
jgi:hypothetical protein